jgi:hypothetical protein
MNKLSAQKKKATLRALFLPCLRCNRLSVAAMVVIPLETGEIYELSCKKCGTAHFLILRRENSSWRVFYDRDTRRYPLEFYDEPPFSTIKIKGISLKVFDSEEQPFANRGPIKIFKRRGLSPAEIALVWRRSNRRCHICGKFWHLGDHGTRGWHLDHDVPNSGGGQDTESILNLLVACSKCNLEKGNGHPQRLAKILLLAFLRKGVIKGHPLGRAVNK